MKMPKCTKAPRHKWRDHAARRKGEQFRSQRCELCGLIMRFVTGPRGGCQEAFDDSEVVR